MKNLLETIKTLGRIVLARTTGITTSTQANKNIAAPTRILFVANAFIPTLQLSFIKPLTALIQTGEVATDLLSEQQMKEIFGKRLRAVEVCDWIGKRFEKFHPTIVVFCRYSGPHVEHILKLARTDEVPTIFHIDDDLLNVPIEVGQKKYDYHNHPSRLAAVKHLLGHVDLVYCSTESLKQRLMSYGFKTRFQAGGIYCSGEVMVSVANKPIKKIGYMGFDHSYDFELVLPAIIQILRHHPQIEFELFGSIPKPSSLDEFGARVRVIPPVPQYEEFMKKFAELGWDIGICPLVSNAFNAVKANTKWVEYTSVGAAVIASAGTVYDTCCSDNCGVLATTVEEWRISIEAFISDSTRRVQLVSKARKRLIQEYSVNHLRNQVLNIFQQANDAANHKHNQS